jgi:transcriptional regulator with XRE-family HTH domain
MSSKIFTGKVLVVTAENITLRGVSRKHDEELADYLRQKLNEGATLRGIEERSGGSITHSYLSKLLSGAASNPSRDKLKAIALGLGVPEDEVFAAAQGRTRSESEVFNSEIYLMLKGYDELSKKDKVELLPTVRMLSAEIRRRNLSTPKDEAVERNDDAAPQVLPIIDTRTPEGRRQAASVTQLSKRDSKKRA